MLIEMTPKRKAMFWEKVSIIEDDDSCWPWTGFCNENGYGCFDVTVDGKQVRNYAHRISYDWENGGIPEGRIVRHKCDNPPCVRPSHLLSGSHQDNVDDKMERGRYVSATAEITEEDAVKIRLLKAGGITTSELCKQFDLSSQHVNAICRGLYWPNAGGPITRRFEIDDETIWAIQIGYPAAPGEKFMDKCRYLSQKHDISVPSVQNIVRRIKRPDFPLSFYTF